MNDGFHQINRLREIGYVKIGEFLYHRTFPRTAPKRLILGALQGLLVFREHLLP